DFGYNLVYGSSSLIENISGFANLAIGNSSLEQNKSGNNNVAVGRFSLQNNISGIGNLAVGNYSLVGNKTGGYNTSIGYYATLENSDGSFNTAIGANSLYDNEKGSYNTAIGYYSLKSLFKGMNNTTCGAESLSTPTKGNNNTALGYMTDMSGNFNNATAIGAEALVDASNKVRIGNSSIISNGGQVEWTAYSDARIKTNVKENVPGLAFINLLKPVTYHFDVDKQNEIMGVRNTEQVEGMYDIEKIQWTGFIAQDVEAAAKKINYDFSGVDNSGEIMGLRYSEFVVPLVKAVQELSRENEKLKMENEEFENRITKLEKYISKQGIVLADDLNNTESKTSITLQNVNSEASLSQNIPNPFTGKTTIQYFVPEAAQAAQIKIVNANGVNIFLADVKLGAGVLEIDATQLSAGTYSYTLLVDGKVIDTKLMVITR
ncbi:MAG: tail fiber domain-containing protein, partial [Chitinophagales bacterium]